LHDLEEQLARRSCPEPAADFRARVLGAMTDATTLPVPERVGRRWLLIGRAAAAIVLALNIALCAANAVRFQQLSEVVVAKGFVEQPGLPEGFDTEERLHQFAARALTMLTPAPDLGALGQNLFRNEEEGAWDMR